MHFNFKKMLGKFFGLCASKLSKCNILATKVEKFTYFLSVLINFASQNSGDFSTTFEMDKPNQIQMDAVLLFLSLRISQ